MARVRELPTARARLRRWLDGAIDDPLVRHDMLLAGTELCTDAVQRDAGSQVVLRAWIEDHSVLIEVAGPAGHAVDGSVANLADSRSESRYRAGLLDKICDEVSTTTTEDIRSVRCRRRIGRPAPAR